MNSSFWSDEDRLFVPRLLGWSINFKFIAKRLGWIKTPSPAAPQESVEAAPSGETREARLRRAVERSRSEDR